MGGKEDLFQVFPASLILDGLPFTFGYIVSGVQLKTKVLLRQTI